MIKKANNTKNFFVSISTQYHFLSVTKLRRKYKMSLEVKLSFYEFITRLSKKEATIGYYLGISDQKKHVWTFAIYLGRLVPALDKYLTFKSKK